MNISGALSSDLDALRARMAERERAEAAGLWAELASRQYELPLDSVLRRGQELLQALTPTKEEWYLFLGKPAQDEPQRLLHYCAAFNPPKTVMDALAQGTDKRCMGICEEFVTDNSNNAEALEDMLTRELTGTAGRFNYTTTDFDLKPGFFEEFNALAVLGAMTELRNMPTEHAIRVRGSGGEEDYALPIVLAPILLGMMIGVARNKLVEYQAKYSRQEVLKLDQGTDPAVVDLDLI